MSVEVLKMSSHQNPRASEATSYDVTKLPSGQIVVFDVANKRYQPITDAIKPIFDPKGAFAFAIHEANWIKSKALNESTDLSKKAIELFEPSKLRKCASYIYNKGAKAVNGTKEFIKKHPREIMVLVASLIVGVASYYLTLTYRIGDPYRGFYKFCNEKFDTTGTCKEYYAAKGVTKSNFNKILGGQ